MRVALAAFSVFAAFSAVVVVACSEDTPATPATDAGPSTATDARGQGEEEPHGDEDGGPPRSPDGCLLVSTGFLSGKKVESVARTEVPGAVSWSDPTNALAVDDAGATVTLSEGQQSEYLRVTDFGFDVPTTAATWGIEAELKRRALNDSGVLDSIIDVTIEGAIRVENKWKYYVSTWPRSIVGTHPYGQPTDTWGYDLYPKDVNHPSFAVRLAVRRADDAGPPGPATAYVESLRVAIWYCPDPPKQ